jgi:hypothetical protein
MKDQLLAALHELESKEHIHILFASEVGSHAWGYASTSSDYDIRFMFVHASEKYLAIDSPLEDLGLDSEEHQLELRGWELRKTLRLFRKSNPSLFEALHSPIIYRKNDFFLNKMTQLEPSMMSKRTLSAHYYHMARQNLQTWEKAASPPIKLLFHCLRPVLMCQWLENNQTYPPLALPDLLTQWSLSETTLFDGLNKKRQNVGDHLDKTDPMGLSLYRVIREAFKTIEEKRVTEAERQKESGALNPVLDKVLNDFFRQMLSRFPASI